MNDKMNSSLPKNANRDYRRWVQEHGIDLTEILYVMTKNRALIQTCVFLGLLLGLSLSLVRYIQDRAIKPFTVKSAIALTAQTESGLFTRQFDAPDSTDIHLAEDIVDAAIFILRSDDMLNSVIEKANLVDITTKELYNSLKLERYLNTQIIQMELYWQTPSEGVRVLETMNSLIPDILIKTMHIGNVTVVNVPTARFSIGGNIRIWFNLALGLVLGLALCFILAFLKMCYMPTLLSPRNLNQLFRISLLGSVPFEEIPEVQEEQPRIETNPTHMRSRDVYRAAAYSIRRKLRDREHPCLLVTSTERGEGRTSAVVNLALALSNTGLRVLAVDFDFANPMLGGLLAKKVDYTQSLNALYKGTSSEDEAVIHLSSTLDMLPTLLEAGGVPFGASVFELIQRIKMNYDIVLLDTAPVGQTADTMELRELTDLALFVVAHDQAPLEAIGMAMGRLENADITVVGGLVIGERQASLKMLLREGSKRRAARKKKKHKATSEKRKASQQKKGSLSKS